MGHSSAVLSEDFGIPLGVYGARSRPQRVWPLTAEEVRGQRLHGGYAAR